MNETIATTEERKEVQKSGLETLTAFENDQFGSVRTVVRDGEPWFVAADVCRALELGNSRQVIDCLDDDEKGVISTDTPGGIQEMSAVNAPGLYTFVFGTSKPEARAFKRWITQEVIPTIRRHVAYATRETLENIISDPDFVIRLLNMLKDERAKREKLESALKVARPKAAYFDALVERNTLTGITETAKELQWREKDFIHFLLAKGYVYRDQKHRIQPHAAHVADGLFVLNERKSVRNGWSGTQLLITPKGRETFRLLRLVGERSCKTMITDR